MKRGISLVMLFAICAMAFSSPISMDENSPMVHASDCELQTVIGEGLGGAALMYAATKMGITAAVALLASTGVGAVMELLMFPGVLAALLVSPSAAAAWGYYNIPW